MGVVSAGACVGYPSPQHIRLRWGIVDVDESISNILINEGGILPLHCVSSCRGQVIRESSAPTLRNWRANVSGNLFSRLPPEILSSCFQFLHPDIFNNISVVCKLWFELSWSPSVWRGGTLEIRLRCSRDSDRPPRSILNRIAKLIAASNSSIIFRFVYPESEEDKRKGIDAYRGSLINCAMLIEELQRESSLCKLDFRVPQEWLQLRAVTGAASWLFAALIWYVIPGLLHSNVCQGGFACGLRKIVMSADDGTRWERVLVPDVIKSCLCRIPQPSSHCRDTLYIVDGCNDHFATADWIAAGGFSEQLTVYVDSIKDNENSIRPMTSVTKLVMRCSRNNNNFDSSLQFHRQC